MHSGQVVDFYGFIVHHIEHFFVNGFYKKSHKPHHNYINPKLLECVETPAILTPISRPQLAH